MSLFYRAQGLGVFIFLSSVLHCVYSLPIQRKSSWVEGLLKLLLSKYNLKKHSPVNLCFLFHHTKLPLQFSIRTTFLNILVYLLTCLLLCFIIHHYFIIQFVPFLELTLTGSFLSSPSLCISYINLFLPPITLFSSITSISLAP